MNPRLIRLAAILAAGPITRDQADIIAPASNGPHYVRELRRKLGIELECDRVPFVTKDGAPSWYGRYTPTRKERAQLQAFVIEQGGHPDE